MPKNEKIQKMWKNIKIPKKCISKDIYAYFDRFDKKNIKKWQQIMVIFIFL